MASTVPTGIVPSGEVQSLKEAEIPQFHKHSSMGIGQLLRGYGLKVSTVPVGTVHFQT